MTSRFIEDNRGFLMGMSRTIRVVSLVLVILGTLWAAAKAVALIDRLGRWDALREEWANVPPGIFLYLSIGVIGLGVSSLLKYMCDPEYKPNWIARHGDKLMYAYAAFIVIQGVVQVSWHFYVCASIPLGYWVMVIVADLLFVLGAVIVLAGLAQVYKRLMPMIDEARALV